MASESPRLRERYGETVNGMSLLLARRLVEAGVPFVTVFWMENERLANRCKSAGGWDTHGNNFNCLKDYLLPEFDRGFSALIEDLAGRGLLDQTLVLVTSEMGRKPKIGDPRSKGISARAVITGLIASPISWPAEASVAARPTGRAIATRNTRRTGRSPRRTSPRRSITRWASKTSKPATARTGRTTCWPRANRSPNSSDRDTELQR